MTRRTSSTIAIISLTWIRRITSSRATTVIVGRHSMLRVNTAIRTRSTTPTWVDTVGQGCSTMFLPLFPSLRSRHFIIHIIIGAVQCLVNKISKDNKRYDKQALKSSEIAFQECDLFKKGKLISMNLA